MEFAAKAASDAYLEELFHTQNRVSQYESELKEIEALKKSVSEAHHRQEETEFTFGVFKDAMELNREIHKKRINELIGKGKQINQQYIEESRRSRELESANREIEFAAEVRSRHMFCIHIHHYHHR